MSATYGRTNLITSFGFSALWRKQCVRQVKIESGDTVFDLMSGMGELWPDIGRRLSGGGRIRAVDFSAEMCARAEETASRLHGVELQMRQEDILDNGISDGAADVVVSSFGLKTFSPEQRARLAEQVARILRPGGVFSLLEISVPRFPPMRWPYMLYLKYAIPFLGRLFLGNPDNYRMLGVYTESFGDCRGFVDDCASAGLEVTERRFFLGCASAVVGRKPTGSVAPTGAAGRGEAGPSDGPDDAATGAR
jgi:demethylmenaquinone methyltransferase/2-methoxy-6-polyprenyl-1,4-benzoquinol methylase